jgi:hypothetical protein
MSEVVVSDSVARDLARVVDGQIEDFLEEYEALVLNSLQDFREFVLNRAREEEEVVSASSLLELESDESLYVPQFTGPVKELRRQLKSLLSGASVVV